MAEIEITLPTVQYGNVKLRGTPEEFGVELTSPWSVGQMTATYLNLFTQGFQDGARRDVVAPVGASQDADMVEAAKLLGEGLGGVTELPEHPEDTDPDEARTAPWNKQVDAPKKPWETGDTPAPKPVVDTDW